MLLKYLTQMDELIFFFDGGMLFFAHQLYALKIKIIRLC